MKSEARETAACDDEFLVVRFLSLLTMHQERRRAMNKGLSDKLEDQVVATMNQVKINELPVALTPAAHRRMPEDRGRAGRRRHWAK